MIYHIYFFEILFLGLMAISPILNRQFATLWTILKFSFDYKSITLNKGAPRHILLVN